MDKYWYGKARTVEVGISAVATGSSIEVPVFAAPFRCKIKKCSVIFKESVTGVATNNMVLGFKNKGTNGSGTDVIASKTFTAGVNGTEYTETDLGDVSNNELALATVITFYKSENGTGYRMPDLLAKLEIVRI